MFTFGTVPGLSVSPERKYFDAVDGVALAHRVSGTISLTGSARADFLGRMSTQDSAQRSPGSAYRNILTNDKGRIVDVVWQIHSDNAIMLLSGHPAGEPLREWLDKYIFAEDVQLHDVTPWTFQFVILGNQSPSFLSRVLGVERLPSVGMCLRKEFGPCWITCFKDDSFQTPAYILLGESHAGSEKPSVPSEFAGAQIHLLESEFLDIMRIESGIPSIGAEIDHSINPLEVNLKDSVSFSKGCYIGQEVIARIETYHKLQKRLVGYSFPSDTGHVLGPGEVVENGRNVGRTTSHCYSYKLNRQIALGYLSTHSSGIGLRLINPEGAVDATVHQLPFEV